MDYSNMKVVELRQLAAARGILGITRMKKANMLVALEAPVEEKPKGSPLKGLKEFSTVTGIIPAIGAPALKKQDDGTWKDMGTEIVAAGNKVRLDPSRQYVQRWLEMGAIE